MGSWFFAKQAAEPSEGLRVNEGACAGAHASLLVKEDACGVEEGTSDDDAGIISRDIMMCRVAQLEWLSTRFFVKNAK